MSYFEFDEKTITGGEIVGRAIGLYFQAIYLDLVKSDLPDGTGIPKMPIASAITKGILNEMHSNCQMIMIGDILHGIGESILRAADFIDGAKDFLNRAGDKKESEIGKTSGQGRFTQEELEELIKVKANQ